MANMNISSVTETNVTDAMVTQADVTVGATYKVAPTQLDSPQDQEENFSYNDKFSIYLGYYKSIPEASSAVDAVASWTLGDGIKADPETTLILDGITGAGKDTVHTVMENMIRVYQIGRDSYAEIIRDDDGNLINLKPLNPANIVEVYNSKGRLTRYEQINKIKKTTAKFEPNEIFHLSRDRIGDEMHGFSIMEACEKTLLFRNEVLDDWKRVLHRNLDPMWVIEVDEDDPVKLEALAVKYKNIKAKGEGFLIPKGAVIMTPVVSSIQNPLPTIDALTDYFWQGCGVPSLIVGSSKTLTEASSKMTILTFKQKIINEQMYIVDAFRAQLNLIIKLEFPIQLFNELISEIKKPEVEALQPPFEPNDLTAEVQGRK